MRINEVTVKALFGLFNHRIPLSQHPPITIIHGPNGFGKTVVLKMLDGLFNGRFTMLKSVPYHEIAVTLDTSTVLTVQRREQETKQSRKRANLFFRAIKGKKEIGSFTLDDAEYPPEFPIHAMEEYVPHLNRIGADEWLDVSTGRHLSSQDVMDEYSDDMPFRFKEKRSSPPWLKDLLSCVSVHLVDTDRLRPSRPYERRRHPRQRVFSELAVLRYADDLAERIRSKLAESAALSQSLDRTFPARLVQHGLPAALADDDIRNRLSQLEEKRSRLKAAGLLDKDEDMGFQISSQTLDEHTKQVLAVYANDVEKKLSIFDDIASKLELFETLVNARFVYKELAINKDSGFQFSSTDGTPLSPSDLSSGEQHELVLLYELLFRVPPKSLILIDEPEISLHVAWQEQFLPDLEKITAVSAFDVLIATHSPQIIRDKWDLTVELKGPDKTATPEHKLVQK